jgi:hypothetical protein
MNLRQTIYGQLFSTVLPILICAWTGLSPVSAYGSTIDYTDVRNNGVEFGKPEYVPPVNPPIDTPAFNNGLINAPDMMPPSVPSHTLPGSDFGQAVVPVPAALWLFGSGLLGLVAISRRRQFA